MSIAQTISSLQREGDKLQSQITPLMLQVKALVEKQLALKQSVIIFIDKTLQEGAEWEQRQVLEVLGGIDPELYAKQVAARIEKPVMSDEVTQEIKEKIFPEMSDAELESAKGRIEGLGNEKKIDISDTIKKNEVVFDYLHETIVANLSFRTTMTVTEIRSGVKNSVHYLTISKNLTGSLEDMIEGALVELVAEGRINKNNAGEYWRER